MARSEGTTKQRSSRPLNLRTVSLLFSALWGGAIAAFSIWLLAYSHVVPVKVRIIYAVMLWISLILILILILILYPLYSKGRTDDRLHDRLLYIPRQRPEPSPDDELAMTVILYFLNLSRK